MVMASNFLLFFLLLSLLSTSSSSSSSSSDKDLLLTFKSSLTDPISSLSSWSHSTPLCNWLGVSCSKLSPPTIFSVDLQSLKLSGDISPSLCQLSSLSHLNLAHNLFNNSIPLHLSQCTSLLYLNLSNNLLWGTLPDQISQLSSLTALDLSNNHIEGQLPLALGSLGSLQVLNLGTNVFSGTLHPSLFNNLSGLVQLDLSQNPSMSSVLPDEIGSLKKLKWLLMQSSGLYGNIPDSLLGLDQIEVLDLSQNNLTGKLPPGFGLELGKLVSLDLSQNKLSGPFPGDVCYGKALVEVSLSQNFFAGSVPKAIEQCLSLERFEVHSNEFSGEFPSGLWSLPKVRVIRAENNQFSGEIPESVAVPLEQVQIDNNSFSGKIPLALGKINTMYRFSASRNGLYGNLPDNIFDSPALSIINLSRNSLSGSIPELKNCKRLVSLSLAGNSFTGNIPSSLAELPVLTYIDLSSNNLSGEIPQGLQNLKLALFNVSFNQLSGLVPASLTAGFPASFLQGNPDLCGPGLPKQCNDREKGPRSRTKGLIIALATIAFAVAFILLAFGIFVAYRLYQRKSCSSCLKSVFFYPLKITGDELMMSLDEKSNIGRGPFGKVHLFQLPNGQFVVLKRLVNSQSLSYKKLKGEIKTLAKARHKSLAKLLGFCYSEGEILLIYEYYHKGSLGDALSSSIIKLNWKVRCQIALGTARGLAYLHKDYVPSLLHRNLKSNNILLDEDFEPKVTDIGLDRVVGETSFQSSIASELNSCCIIAPEHGCSEKATEQMDVYSFGVVLLELITGRKAEQQESSEAPDVVKWVRRKINMTNGSLQVLDAKISASSQEEMLQALELALRCTSLMPENRPMIEEVVRLLEALNSS
ncbi:uncharacterized protein A4U43_C05F12430 [Asparagus officinalis]|uniref:Protein kinase domain-containing protein n=1 Tax=Asparagus officinalis TaxID=4686 RepID=A0A5P1ER64_ASPOF|nr:probably inactive leucine-rich repeat receptor-like protein kinase At5g06940 [Asparagus officinalis]ONK68502.1 uncharacterized protein A4U43_C05F12430 [Asparagus officinalis]